MERPDLFRYDREQGTQPEGGISSRTPQVSRLAGHLTLGNRPGMENTPRHVPTPKAAEAVIAAALQPESNRDVQYSAWHRIEKDEQGNVKGLAEQRYGQALLREMDAEQGMPVSQSSVPDDQSAVSSGSVSIPTQMPASPASPQIMHPQTPVVLQPTSTVQSTFASQADVSSLPSNDDVAVLPHFNRPDHRSAYEGQAQGPEAALPAQVPQPTVPAPMASPFNQVVASPLQPALDPEHQLSTGPLTQDPEHMLPAPKKNKLVATLKSPWFWLVIGVGLIIYFV